MVKRSLDDILLLNGGCKYAKSMEEAAMVRCYHPRYTEGMYTGPGAKKDEDGKKFVAFFLAACEHCISKEV